MLTRQERPADRILIAATEPADVAGLACDGEITVLTSAPGLTRQRNAILDVSAQADVLVFFDDDFFPQPDYLLAIERLFLARRDVVMATGAVIADGILGPGFSPEQAQRFLADDRRAHPPSPVTEEGMATVYNGYGCNMAVRMDPVRTHTIRFDEAIPLYGWLEDVDFSRRLARYGAIVETAAARGVHLGAKRGRQSGVKLGYSQIANPIYLLRKQTFSPHRAVRMMAINVTANIVKSIRPEPYIDRHGRLAGNARAAVDLLKGRLHPERILEM